MIHNIEYSKSSRAKCHGDPPCKGTPIELGALRYGRTVNGPYGETVQWRHWGCVTPNILGQLAGSQLQRLPGFSKLSSDDQAKIIRAVKNRRIDAADIPVSARPTDAAAIQRVASSSQLAPSSQPSSSQTLVGTQGPSSSQSTTQKKRKGVPESSQPSSSQVPSHTEVIDVDAEDDEPEEEGHDELYVMLLSQIVGVQYYNGLVGAGQEVRLFRDPRNAYDRNAVEVQNVNRQKVGHLPRNIVERLSPLVDSNLITVEGVMNQGNLTGGKVYTLAMTLKLYGAPSKRDQLEPLLIWATPGQRGFPPRNPDGTISYVPGAPQPPGAPRPQAASTSRAPPQTTEAQRKAYAEQQEAARKANELRQMLNNLEKVDDEGRRSSLLDTLCSKDDILNLPVHPGPPGISTGELTVNILKHQSQALNWCLQQEYPKIPKSESDKPVQFWQFKKNAAGKSYYYNLATKTPQQDMPVLGRGALCADSMGLGKTLTMLSLIIATKDDIPPDYSRSTLIIVPLSVMSNWETQIKEHCTPGTLSTWVYYGNGRSLSSEDLKKYDVVITTYQVVTSEHDSGRSGGNDGPSQKKKAKLQKGLFNVQWKRIILDEGHTIRNPRTKLSKAVYELPGQRRWVVTGTPIINSPKDLGSILTFLRICQPLDNEDFFKRLLLRPLKVGDPSGAQLLKALMSQICIRRTKEMQDSEGNHLVPLPPVEMTLIPVKLHDDARQLYDAVREISMERVQSYMDRQRMAGLNISMTTHVISMLTRLRQLALHPGLVPANYLEELRQLHKDEDRPPPSIKLTPEIKIRLQAALAQLIEDSEECPICFTELTDPRMTTCGHAFCLACISEVITRDPKCPMDRRQITMSDLIEPAPPTEMTQAPIKDEEEFEGMNVGSSAKIDQLVHLLKLTPSSEKSLVFSQFTSFLDKIAEALAAEGIPYVRFDGKLSAKKRQEALVRFNVPLKETNPSPATQQPASTQRKRKAISLAQAMELHLDDLDEDFVPKDHDSDDSFLDDDLDDGTWMKSSKSKKGKGKAKAAKSKGKGKQKRAEAYDEEDDFDLGYASGLSGENPVVMLISLKAGSLGLNLTVANNVYLMDPWWQEGIESQAIDRVNRIGQKKPVHVFQLIAEDTVESQVMDIQERKKALIKQAFSGIKSVETQRQRKETRIQELVELFGMRRQAAEAGGNVLGA